jgi:hypothetical protein
MVMTDTTDTGEAAMLALGERLVWRELEGFTGEWYAASDIENPYTISCDFNEGGNNYWARIAFCEAAELPYSTLAAAKRACEIHAATGKWE